MANFNNAKTAVTFEPPSVSLSYLLPHRVLEVVCPRLQDDHTEFFVSCMCVSSFKFDVSNMKKEQGSQKPLPIFSGSLLLTYGIQVVITSSY